ncbi:MAG: transporter substrate-binding domain-containing protein [Gammaproteobacteria bacterium]|nr:transporter substrate-binding domain-containing protein [Gammaproteobacteria bacterium]MBU1556219.1 transporter substrate-binding domain-containing protein [Gammaproteobacteria bacterium]MBU2072263.1 transporter substrate-binding domain-containing protein [Gammaproteobacteria bacterium]MBU2181869.1 transporter substrate-binding domain-containing protein [Gammaproteobacteria bacterium]MBU2205114.1 transporter substrate-binding domain-containing protein [Gammaproteobacteria bacterium]
MILRLFACLLLLISIDMQAEGNAAGLPDPLLITISNDTYPYMFIDEQGEAAGLVVDYWQEVAKRQDITVRFIAADWSETLQLLDSGQVHLHGGIARTDERSARYAMGATGIAIYSNIFVHRDIPHLTRLSELTPFAIGVVAQSSHVDTILQQVPAALLKPYPSVTAMYDAALAGDIKVMTGLDRLPPRYHRHTELVMQFPLYRKIPLRNIMLSYATNKNMNLMAAIQHVTAKIEPAFLERLERRWLGVEADEDTLLLGVPIDNPPYMHVTQQGEAQGLFVDLWQQWSELSGQKIAFVPDTSLNSLHNLVKGRIDVLVAFPDNQNLPAGIAPAYHLYNFPSEFYYLKRNAITDLTDLASGKIAIFANAPYAETLQQRYPQLEFVRFRQLPEMIAGVLNGELAGFFGASAIIPQRLQQLNLTDMFASVTDSELVSPMYSLVQQQQTELAEQIRRGFAQMPLDTLVQTEQRWLTDASQHYFSRFRQQIPLTEDEQDWLKQHKVLRVGMLRNWPPMEFADEDGLPAGVTVDMFNLLAERLNASFEFKLFDDFDSMLQQLQQQQLDLIANVSDRKDRHGYAKFSDVFWPTQLAVISNSSRQPVTSTADLYGSKVAIYQDYELARQLPQLHPQINVVAVQDLAQGLMLLQRNEVDFALDSVESASETLKQTGMLGLRAYVVDDLPHYASLIAVRKDFAPLVVMLNKGLRSISSEERQQLYQKWFSFQISQGMDRQQLNTLMWRIGGAVALLLLFVVLWNVSLRREVALRRKAEQKMRFMATHDDLTQLPNRSLIKERIEQALLQHARHNEIMALLFIDLDGFKEVNDAYGHDAGDELLLKLAGLLDNAVRKSDTVARFGGDEFVVLLTGLLSRDDAAIVAEKILHQMSMPITLSVGEVQVGASIGIAVYPYDGTDSAKLLKVADSLMYRIKQQGKNRYCFSKVAF